MASDFFGRDYSSVDFMNIFAAFESECHAESDLYENVDATRVKCVKDDLIRQIVEYPKERLKQEEIEFLNNAKNRILQLGTQFGQNRKIINAYEIIHNAMDSSIKNIFYQPKFKLKGPLKENELKKIARYLVDQRGAIAHGIFDANFSDIDAQQIRFLEILTYSQLLKRIGLDNLEVERVIGIIFCCNYVILQEKRH